MAITSISRIVELSGPRVEKVFVKAWGDCVYVRAITAAERDRFEGESFDQGKTNADRISNVRARLCVLAMCDEAGNRVLTDADAEALGKAPAAAIDPIYEKAQELAGIGDSAVDNAEKNSGAARGGDSASS